MKKRIILTLLLLIALILGGCATMPKLTEAEADIISQYATQTLVKHSNKNNSLLLSRDKLDDKEKAEEEAKKKAEEEAEKKSEEEKKEEDKKKEENQSESTTPSENSDISGAVESNLSSALGIDGLEAKYTNYKVLDSYSTDYVLIQPTSGNNLLVLNFALTNKDAKNIICDINGGGASFEILINGTARYSNMLTILSSDMSTLNTELAPGATRNVVLVFNIPKASLSNITSFNLLVSYSEGNKMYNIKL